MPSIKASSIRELKNRINILDVVSSVVALKKAGSQFRGLSPFNKEKTPSFFVSPDKGLYKCYSSGKGGDVITFVMETERLSFSEAVEELARRFGIKLEYDDSFGPPQDRSLQSEIFDIHERAAAWFHEAFLANNPGGELIRAYWTGKRRFPLEVAEEFRIGFAPPDYTGLAEMLASQKYKPESLARCGLFFMREGAAVAPRAMRPRFRGRLMIPIRDHQGRVVAFTARQLEITPADDPAHEAKYVNSPETPIFTKSHVLFNLDRARMHVSEKDPFVMVEGQLDAIRCWHSGIRTVVAPQGTAVTEGQLLLLRRYVSRLECFLDGDAAGQRAALRVLPMALAAGLEIRFLPLEPGVDPDSLLRDGGIGALDPLRAKSASAMAFACRAHLPEPAKASPEEKARASQAVIELVAAAGSAVARMEFLAEAAGHLQTPPAALQTDFDVFLRRRARSEAIRAGIPGGAGAAPAPPPPAAEGPHPPEEDLLLICLHHEQLGLAVAGVLPHDWVDTAGMAGRLLNRFLAEFEHDHWPGMDHLDALLETAEERAYIGGLAFSDPGIEDPVGVVNQALGVLNRRRLQPELRQIELEIARGPANLDDQGICLLRRKQAVEQQIRNPPKLPPTH